MSVSFATDIKPFFTSGDVGCMHEMGVELDDYAYISDPAGDGKFADHANARSVHAHLTGASAPRMPFGGPYWSDQKISLFEQWMTGGFQA